MPGRSSGKCRPRVPRAISTASPSSSPAPTTTAFRTPGRWRISAASWESPVAVRTRHEAVADAEALLDTRLVAIGTWLFHGAEIFFFAAWWVAFFYLRAINNHQGWQGEGAGPPSKGCRAGGVALAGLDAR